MLYKYLVTSILLCGCETWNLLADSDKKKERKKRIQAFETKCLGNFSASPTLSTRPTTGCGVRSTSLWVPGTLLATVKRRKLAWVGHVNRHNSLSKTILQGTLEDGRCRSRQKKCRIDNIKQWTSLPMPELLTRALCRKDWKKISAKLSSNPTGQGTELNSVVNTLNQSPLRSVFLSDL